MKTYSVYIIILIFSLSVCAQKDTDVLLHINEELIEVSEFKQVYLKNIDLLKETSQIEPTEYLDLFIPYKLKVQEAYKLGFNERQTYKDEIKGYTKQLAKAFLTDVDLTDKIVKEAYDRMVNEVKAKHILARVALTAPAKDTLTAYNKALEARNKIVEGEDFEKVAKEYSQDPSVKKNGGDLGWFKAFKMVYAFENTAYNTDVGEVSMPFRTPYGYHILQTTGKRKGEGSLKMAHIMIQEKQNDKTINPKERIDKIYSLLQSGEDFASLAKTYSDDKQTGPKGGTIKEFERGDLSSPKFEEMAFSLTKEGTYSKPFQSKFGWHICKLIKRLPIKSFEEEKSNIEDRLKKDKRSKVISEALTRKLRKKYELEDITATIALIKDKTIGDFNNKNWIYNNIVNNGSKPAFSIKDSVYEVKEFAKFIERHYDPIRYTDKDIFFEDRTRKYIDLKLLEYQEKHLEEIEPDFKAVLREYKEGLLIFALMEDQIWNKAKSDSVGLERYYNANKRKYISYPKATTTLYTSQDKAVLVNFRNNLLSDKEKALENIPDNLLKTTKDLVINERTSYASEYTPKQGVSDVFMYNEGYVLYDVSEVHPEHIKTFKESKGQVISDYQIEIESDWVEELRSNASVTINKRVLRKLKKQLKKQLN